jgi:hypothetical protein
MDEHLPSAGQAVFYRYETSREPFHEHDFASIVQAAAGPADALTPEQWHAVWLEISAFLYMPSTKPGGSVGHLFRTVDERHDEGGRRGQQPRYHPRRRSDDRLLASRLRPRLAAPTRGQAYETVMPVEVREWRLAVPHRLDRGSVSTSTGSPEAVARPRFPQNVPCGFPAPTLFGSCFTALQAPAAPGRGGAV